MLVLTLGEYKDNKSSLEMARFGGCLLETHYSWKKIRLPKDHKH